MKKIIFSLTLMLCCATMAMAQQVTKTRHTKALKTDVVTTGTMTIRKPDYICISTDGGKDQLIMDGTKFTMVADGRKHKTDSKKNAQFATFHQVLHAVINGQAVKSGGELQVERKGRQLLMTITPATKKKRQLFSSFLLVTDAETSAIQLLRMNDAKGGYTEYVIK